jgi:hypothetical protein
VAAAPMPAKADDESNGGSEEGVLGDMKSIFAPNEKTKAEKCFPRCTSRAPGRWCAHSGSRWRRTPGVAGGGGRRQHGQVPLERRCCQGVHLGVPGRVEKPAGRRHRGTPRQRKGMYNP